MKRHGYDPDGRHDDDPLWLIACAAAFLFFIASLFAWALTQTPPVY